MNSAAPAVAVKGTVPPAVSTGNTISRDEWIDRARRIAPVIRAEALNTEQGNTLSPVSVAAMRETELFWAGVPEEVGGYGCSLTTMIEILEEVAFADGSSGWSLMANALATAAAGAFAGDECVQEIFGGAERPIMAGMYGPAGKAVEVDGGYRGSGSYSFGSGCNHADWLGGGMFVMENGEHKLLPDGTPEVRICFVPREKVVFKGNWNVAGLAGTGSYDYEIPEQFFPEPFTMERTAKQPQRGGAPFHIGLLPMGNGGHAAMALGICRRALQEIAIISTSRKRVGSASLIADSDIFRHQFALQEANYQAARAYVLKVFDDVERAIETGEPFGDLARQRIRQATTWAHNVAAEVVNVCHLWGSSASFRKPSALGRCMEDMHVATQHILVDQNILADAARAVLDHWTGPDA